MKERGLGGFYCPFSFSFAVVAKPQSPMRCIEMNEDEIKIKKDFFLLQKRQWKSERKLSIIKLEKHSRMPIFRQKIMRKKRAKTFITMRQELSYGRYPEGDQLFNDGRFAKAAQNSR